MRIPAPNYTQTPNVLYDEVFKTLKEGEVRIVLVIMRQTFGWHKPADRISLSQLADKSGMNRPSVCRSLNSLMKKGLVTKKKFGPKGQERCYYSLVIDETENEKILDDDGIETEEEMQLISNNLDQSPKETRPVSQRDQTSLLKRPTKETLTKEKAAAVPLQKKKAENKKPEIYPILDSVDIPHSQKKRLFDYFDEKIVTDAIGWATHPSNPPRESLAQSIWFACNEGLSCAKFEQKKKKAKDIEEDNKAYAMKYNGQEAGICFIENYRTHVEIYTGNPHSRFCLRYSDKGFMEQFNNALRKHKFRILEDS